MKDEYGVVVIIEFCGLKSKMYATIDENDNENCANKGHNAFIDLNKYEEALFQKKI